MVSDWLSDSGELSLAPFHKLSNQLNRHFYKLTNQHFFATWRFIVILYLYKKMQTGHEAEHWKSKAYESSERVFFAGEGLGKSFKVSKGKG